nr:cold-regulated 47 [Tanacetum cinerariifolium]
MQGWKQKLLSDEGHEILIKSVIQAIPSYAMQCNYTVKSGYRLAIKWLNHSTHETESSSSPPRTFVPIIKNATTATPTADPAVIAKEKLVSASVFGGDSSPAGESRPISGDFFDRTGGDFLVGGICTVVDPDSNLQRLYVPHWNVTNEFCMDDGGVCREMVDEFAPLNFLHPCEKIRLKSMVEEKDSLLKSRCNKIKSLKAQLLIKEVEAAEAVRLRDEAQALKERDTYLKKEKSELEIKVTDLAASVKVREQEVADLDAVVNFVKLQNDSLADQLYADFVDMALHLEEKFYPHMLTTIFGRQWLLTHGMELAITKCLHSSKYLSAHETAFGKAIEKGMQDGLAAEITHDVEGRVLADVAAYNPSADADYFSALQRLQNINFSLLAELRYNKNASVDTIMNILHLEDNLSQPDESCFR